MWQLCWLVKFKSAQVPLVNNTNVDRSVAIIHATVLACLRRLTKVWLLASLSLHASPHHRLTRLLTPCSMLLHHAGGAYHAHLTPHGMLHPDCRLLMQGEALTDPGSGACSGLAAAFQECQVPFWSSKRMLLHIRTNKAGRECTVGPVAAGEACFAASCLDVACAVQSSWRLARAVQAAS